MTDLLNTEKPIEWEGKTYLLRKPSVEEEGRYSVWLEMNARDANARDITKSDDERRKADHQITLDSAAGVFDFTGELAAKSLQSVRGSVKLVSIITGGDIDTMDRMFRAKAWEVAELLGKAVYDTDGGGKQAAEQLLKRLGLPHDFTLPGFATSTGRKATKRPKGFRGTKSKRSGSR